MGSKRFTPVRGKEYKNPNGSTYLCLSGGGIHKKNNAVLQHTTSKWTFIALGCVMLQDGTLEWFHSISGRFADSENIATEIQVEAYRAALQGKSPSIKKMLLQDAAADPDIDETALQYLEECAYATV